MIIHCTARDCDRITRDNEHLCGQHQGELQHHLAGLPELLDHIRAHRTPGASNGEPISGSREARLPFNVTAVDDADAIYNLIADISGKLSEILNINLGPMPGWRINGTTAGFSTDLSTRPAIDRIRFICNNFIALIDDEYAGIALEDLKDIAGPVRARWPLEERRWSVSGTIGLRCPKCSWLTLTRYAPTWFGGPTTTLCDRTECGLCMTDHDYEFLIRVEAELAKTKAKKEKATGRR